MLTGIKACFFDMDGTIIDSMGIWDEIDIEFLGRRNISKPDNLGDLIEGFSFDETAHFFKEHFKLKESIAEIQNEWNNMAIDKYRNEIVLKDGVLDFLKYLKANEYKLAIATSNSHELAHGCLTNRGIKDYFDTIITSGQISAGKPAPDVYLKCADDCNIQASECLVFEDILQGIEAGHNAGMKVCAVQDSYSMNIDRQKRELADYYIESFCEIL